MCFATVSDFFVGTNTVIKLEYFSTWDALKMGPNFQKASKWVQGPVPGARNPKMSPTVLPKLRLGYPKALQQGECCDPLANKLGRYWGNDKGECTVWLCKLVSVLARDP